MFGWFKRARTGNRAEERPVEHQRADWPLHGYRIVDGTMRDANGRPVDVGFIEGASREEAVAIASFEGALGRPFAPLLDCGTSDDGSLVLVWPHALPLFETARRHRPSLGVAVELAQTMLLGSELLTRALESQRLDLERDALLRHVHVDAAGVVLRAPLARPHQPARMGTLRGVRLLAPEQVRGRPWQPATDVFAVGAALVELVLGKPLFPVDESKLRVDLERLMRAELPAPLATLGVPAPLAELLEGSFLKAAPEQRCADAAAARAALAPFAGSDDEVKAWLLDAVPRGA
ncbi:MAG: hypothetical protein HYS27_06495 [Deltaproteobacteria bacterium]|nr:hypothetical protein [Deltaproteobacteria bacterium]